MSGGCEYCEARVSDSVLPDLARKTNSLVGMVMNNGKGNCSISLINIGNIKKIDRIKYKWHKLGKNVKLKSYFLIA